MEKLEGRVEVSPFSGTHQGEFMGLPPTGKRIEVDAIDIVRIRNGQLAEHWGVFDAMLMMQQLGAIPETPGQRSPEGRRSTSQGGSP